LVASFLGEGKSLLYQANKPKETMNKKRKEISKKSKALKSNRCQK